jgi:hypothetical protein
VTWSIYRRIDIDFSLLYDNGPVKKSLCTNVLAHQETGQLLHKIAAIDRSLFANTVIAFFRSDESMNGRSG